MFEILPPIVSDAMLIIAFIAGPTGLIWGILQRKDANRKLVVEEGGLEVSEFDSQRAGFKMLLDEQKELTSKALAELKASQDQRNQQADDMDELRGMLIDIRALFKRVVARSNITLTPDEQKEFEATKPPRPRRRVRPATSQ
jgi:hypothetical protein